jgi:hypothetical protein
VQELIELLRVDAQDGFLLADESFAHHLDGDANRRRPGALAVAGLEHVELAVLDGELEVLDVAVVLLEHGGDVAELVVDRGIPLQQLGDGVWRAHAGDHVFALRVLEELAVEGLLAGGRIAGEAHAGGRSLAQVTEHHGLHVDGGAEVVRNLVHLAVVDGAGVEPGAEHGVARALKLSQGILREGLAGFLLDQLLVARDDLFQVFRPSVRYPAWPWPSSSGRRTRRRNRAWDLEHHVAVHLDEAAVAIVGEARTVALGFQRLDGLVVEAEVEDGVHHARHGELGAGSHAHQQRVLDVAELLSHALFEDLERFHHLRVDLRRNSVVVLEVDVADFGGNGEAGGHRQLGPAHFGEPGAFAAERIFHLSITVGGSVAERIDNLLHALLL